MWPNPQFLTDLVTFTEEILNGKLHFLCSVLTSISSEIEVSKSPYSVEMRENAKQKNSEYGNLSWQKDRSIQISFFNT